MSGNAEFVAWACFGLGAVIVLAGVIIGLIQGFGKAPKAITTKVVNAKIAEAREKVQTLETTAVDSAKQETANPTAEKTAATQSEQAQSILQEIGGIVASLPENIRFDGLLVLVGAVLMSVATVQFGGHSLF
jgi:hypothetical protein